VTRPMQSGSSRDTSGAPGSSSVATRPCSTTRGDQRATAHQVTSGPGGCRRIDRRDRILDRAVGDGGDHPPGGRVRDIEPTTVGGGERMTAGEEIEWKVGDLVEAEVRHGGDLQ
jgi:hypothetical protein